MARAVCRQPILLSENAMVVWTQLHVLIWLGQMPAPEPAWSATWVLHPPLVLVILGCPYSRYIPIQYHRLPACGSSHINISFTWYGPHYLKEAL